MWKLSQETDKLSLSSGAESLDTLLERLGPNNEKLLTSEEVEKIKTTGQVTIGSRTIVFGLPEEDLKKLKDYFVGRNKNYYHDYHEDEDWYDFTYKNIEPILDANTSIKPLLYSDDDEEFYIIKYNSKYYELKFNTSTKKVESVTELETEYRIIADDGANNICLGICSNSELLEYKDIISEYSPTLKVDGDNKEYSLIPFINEEFYDYDYFNKYYYYDIFLDYDGSYDFYHSYDSEFVERFDLEDKFGSAPVTITLTINSKKYTWHGRVSVSSPG